MKKIILLLTLSFSLLNFANAQTPPNAFNYSAVARNAAGQPIATTTIGIQVTILKTSPTGASQYSENHFVNTDAYGLFNLVIGAGAVQSGSMATIDWSNDNYYLKVGMDAAGGTNFLTMGTTQLLSVPYALYAKSAGTVAGGITEQTINYFPQSSSKSNTVLVSFSGSSNTDFSQASPVAFQFEQATPIYPYQIRYISNKKIDVKLNIPWDASTGTYDIIINPNNPEPTILEKAFLIDWF